MNLDTIKTTAARSFGRGELYLKAHSPEILLTAGLIGMVAATVMASKATLKAGAIVEEHKDNMDLIEEASMDHSDKYTNEDKIKDTAVLYVQTGFKFASLYGPALGVGLLSIVSILASHGIMAKRQTAIVAAYSLLAETYKNYRTRVVEELGADVDKNYHLGLREESYSEQETDEDGKKVKVKKTRLAVTDDRYQPSIYSRYFDSSNPMWRTDRLLNEAFLRAQQNYLNDELILTGHVFLNRVYERLGFPHTTEGSITGWFLKDAKTMKEEGRDGYIDFGMQDYHVHNGDFIDVTNPPIILDFNVDGVIYHLLKG